MGVVTDVTVKGLTTAVTNISATGMSDTTGQAIVTAINNLSGSISPAASSVTFDNTGTGLTASNAQAAIIEVNRKIDLPYINVSTSSAVSCASGITNYTTLINSGELSAGLWLVTYWGSFESVTSANGNRRIILTTESTGTSPRYNSTITAVACSGSATQLQGCKLLNLSTATTLYLRASHSQGSSITANGELRLTRLTQSATV